MRLGDLLKRADMPIMAGANDRVVGYAEDGQPIRQTRLGDRYWNQPQEAKGWLERQYDEGGIFEPKISDLLPAPTGPVETTREYDGKSAGLGPILQALYNGIKAPGKALMGETVTNRDVTGTALDWGLMTAPATAPAGALRAGGIRAYHGSPHDFDRFDMGKIGTGEGAQAYGHGLYFAEAEDVAKGYRDALAPGMGDGALRAVGVSDGDLRSMRQFTQSSVDPDVALRDWLGWTGKTETPELRDAFMREWSGRNQGHMYEVNINANPDDFLDWDAPLSEQPRIRELVGGMDGKGRDAIDRLYTLESDPIHEAYRRGELPLDEYQRSNPNVQVTERLRKAGIPGIKYKDAGSRGAEGGTRNYVVFDDKLIDIVRKYGLAGLTMGGALGMNGITQKDADTLRSYLGT